MCVKPNLCLRYTLPDGDVRTTILPDLCRDEVSIKEYMRYRPSMGNVLRYEVIPVACQNCWECRLAYSRTWANRCVMEAAMYDTDKSWFVTLTYDDEHLAPLLLDPGAMVDTTTGEFVEWFPDVFFTDDFGVLRQRSTFDKSYLVKFMKDLRRQWEYHHNHTGIRFFQASEYGDLTERSHHHFLLFNIPLFDLEPLFTNKFGDQLYVSQELTDIWGRGHVIVGQFNWNTAAYTARYVMKKLKGAEGRRVYQEARGQMAPFTTMSRMPGIASDFLREKIDSGSIFTIESINDDGVPIFNNCIVLPSHGKTSNVVQVPRYAELMLKADDPERYERLKDAQRRLADMRSKTKMKLTDLTCRDLLSARERSLAAKRAGLYRALEDIF